MNDLEDIAVRFQVYLEGLKTNDFREFNQVLKLIEAAVREELSEGEVRDLSKAKMVALVKRVSKASAEGIQEYMEEFVEKLKDLAVYSYEFEAGAIMAGSTVTGVVEEIARESVWKAALARPLTSTGDLLTPWIEKLETNQVSAIEGLIRRGYYEGWTNSQMLQVLRGTRKNRFTDGLMPRMGSQNATIIRTAVQHVSSASRMRVWEDNQDVVKGYRWISTLDNKTSKQCRSLDQQEFKLNAGPVPPIHPNCRSTTVPTLAKKWDIFDEGATRSSQSGSVPQSWTYYDWLKRQSPAFQDSVIGDARGALLRNGGLSTEEFSRLQLSSTFDPLTLEEMRALKPLAFQRAGI